MRNILALVIAVVLASCASMGDHDPALQFDGVYQSGRTDSYYGYLRFYPDGTVATVSTGGQPNEIREWFDKGHAGTSTGKVILKGKRISFSATSNTGTVDYDGKLVGNQIRLRYCSLINGHCGSEVYEFLGWDAEPKAPDGDAVRKLMKHP